jgi:hypothetical protein
MTRALFVLAALVGASTIAGAQEPPKIGLTVGFPGSFGILWHATDRLAVRPDITFSTSSLDSTTSTNDSTSSAVGIGIAGLFYGTRDGDVRPYVSPRFSYAHNSADSSGTVSISSRGSTYSFAGSFGAQYSPHRRFAAYGEAGFGYTRSTATTTTTSSLSSLVPGLPPGLDQPLRSTSSTTTNNWALRGGVGIVIYF